MKCTVIYNASLKISQNIFILRSDIFKILFLILERGKRREKERERNIDVREKLIGCLLHLPQTGTNPATQACALTSNGGKSTGNLSVCGMMHN